MTKKVAVLLSGCGYLDGAEIREAVLSLLYLDQVGAQVSCFALNEQQHHVMNHLSMDEAAADSRNILAESARIARGKVADIKQLETGKFDALVIPGGFGMAKNFADFAFKGADMNVHPEFERVVSAFYADKKPIGAICIAPVVLVGALKNHVGTSTKLRVTVGDNANVAAAIEALGGIHQNAASDECVVDPEHKIVTCSAYMREDAIAPIAIGIKALVQEVLLMS